MAIGGTVPKLKKNPPVKRSPPWVRHVGEVLGLAPLEDGEGAWCCPTGRSALQAKKIIGTDRLELLDKQIVLVEIKMEKKKTGRGAWFFFSVPGMRGPHPASPFGERVTKTAKNVQISILYHFWPFLENWGFSSNIFQVDLREKVKKKSH